MRDVSDLAESWNRCASRRLSWPLRAARVPSGQLAGRPPGVLRGPAGFPAGAGLGGRSGAAGVAALTGTGACPAVAVGRESEGWALPPAGNRRAGGWRRPGNRTAAGAPRPPGYASLCWPASDPAVRSRAVWGRQGDWLSGRAPRSHRGGHWFDPSIAHSHKRRSRPGFYRALFMPCQLRAIAARDTPAKFGTATTRFNLPGTRRIGGQSGRYSMPHHGEGQHRNGRPAALQSGRCRRVRGCRGEDDPPRDHPGRSSRLPATRHAGDSHSRVRP